MTIEPCQACLDLAPGAAAPSRSHRKDPDCRGQVAVHRALEAALESSSSRTRSVCLRLTAELRQRHGIRLIRWFRHVPTSLVAYWIAASAGIVWAVTSVSWADIEIPALYWVPPVMVAGAALAGCSRSTLLRWFAESATETGHRPS